MSCLLRSIVVSAVCVAGAWLTPRLAWSAAACPALPANAIAVSSSGARADLATRAVTAAIQAWQDAGLVPVNGAAGAAPEFTPFALSPSTTPVCVPTVVFGVFTDLPEAVTLYVTRYSEHVTVTARLTMPDGRLWQGSRITPAAWYVGYVPVPFAVGGFYLSGVPLATSQGAAEQRAVESAAAVLAQDIATMLRVAPVPSAALSARTGSPTEQGEQASLLGRERKTRITGDGVDFRRVPVLVRHAGGVGIELDAGPACSQGLMELAHIE